MLSNAESGAERIGTIRVYGTGGTKGANWEAFGNCFYNPGKNDMLPMENIWDTNSRHAVCGFFFLRYGIMNLLWKTVILYCLLLGRMIMTRNVVQKKRKMLVNIIFM